MVPDLAAFLKNRVERQLDNIVPGLVDQTTIPADAMLLAIERTNRNLLPVAGRVPGAFDYLVSGQYATFLYYLSNVLSKQPDQLETATRLFLLNKALNGIDLYFEVEMPDHFLIGHTVGMVFAKASYGNFCIFHQGCTVGRTGPDRPVLEECVMLYPNASVLGRCYVRRNTVISAGVQLINTDTPGDCIVFAGEKGRPVFRPIEELFVARHYKAEYLPAPS